jgi:hypothetical protein
MIYKIIILLLAFNTPVAYAKDDQVFIEEGMGFVTTGTQSKEVGTGIQEDVWGTLKQRGVVGGFIDPSSGRSGSAFAFGQLGLEVQNGLVGAVFVGPGFISSTDTLLRDYVEIMSDIHLGIEDRDNNYIGLAYKNISFLGPSSRNYIGLEIRFPI